MLQPAFPRPGLFKLVASMLYESLLLIAILALVTLLFLLLAGDATSGYRHHLLQLLLWLSAGAYFVWCWHHSGQTLAMQTWRIRVVDVSGQPLSWRQACQRYVLASVLFGASFLWACFDREGLFLHDRLSGSRLVLQAKKADSAA